jgi:hypothetical protein
MINIQIKQLFPGDFVSLERQVKEFKSYLHQMK